MEDKQRRRCLAFLLTGIFLCTLTACALQASQPAPRETAAPEASLPQASEPLTEETVAFADPALEKLVRGAIGKPAGEIAASDAAAVTRLDLSADWERHASEWIPVKALDGLEYFTGLESLDLTDHAITDITPLAGLTKLDTLALGGNPIADISPLAGLTSLKTLVLTGCAAEDYGALSKLTGLEHLRLEHSTIADASPLAGLTNLKQLYLEGCKLDYAPLADICPNLAEKDFVIVPAPSTLAELGFVMDDARKQAIYDGERASVRINHDEWGYSGEDSMQNCVRTVFGTDGYKVDIGYYPEHDAYVVLAYKNGEFVLNYLYFVADGSFSLDSKFAGRESAEAHIRAIFPEADGDLLLAPVDFYNSTVESACGMTADELFAMPFATLSLASLGFVARQEVCGYQYVYQNEAGDYFDVSIHDPKQAPWEGGGEVRFFTPLSKEYRIVVVYHMDEKRFSVGADDNGGGGAEYSFFISSGEHVDVWCSDDGLTVEQYFIRAINDPLVTDASDVYQYSVKRMVVAVESTFGMGIDELFALPAQ